MCVRVCVCVCVYVCVCVRVCVCVFAQLKVSMSDRQTRRRGRQAVWGKVNDVCQRSLNPAGAQRLAGQRPSQAVAVWE